MPFWARGLLLSAFHTLATVTSSSNALTSSPGQAVIPLYLTNVTLDPYQPRQGSNTAYFGVYEVGTPPKQFTGCFDTGSADAWLPLATCLSQACLTHDTYNPNASSTYEASSVQFSIQYATGSVFGGVARDTVRLGGIAIAEQAFGTVTVAGGALLQSSCDGIFGLGFPSISQLKSLPPFFQLVNQSLLDQNTFSFWLSQQVNAEPAGELVLGGSNPARFTGPVTFIDLPVMSYWSLPLTSLKVGTANVSPAAFTAIIDSGSTAITVGVIDGAAIHDEIPGAVYWADMGVYNLSSGCNVSSLPAVSVILDSTSFSIPPELWVIKLNGVCISGFVPSGRGSQMVLGVPFLRAWHTQYSYDPMTDTAQIGLAAPKASSSSSAASSSQISAFGRRLLSTNTTGGGTPPAAPSLPSDNFFTASIPSAAERGL